MASNLRKVTPDSEVPSAEDMTFGIVVAEWHPEITNTLLEGAYNTLLKYGAHPNDIIIKHVPGTVEITLGAQFMAEYTDSEAIICLGCVVKGDTPHFDYVCQSVTQGITHLNLEYNLPFVFGVLTVNTYEQALERTGGKLGNKGEESAIVAIKMAAMQRDMEYDTDLSFKN